MKFDHAEQIKINDHILILGILSTPDGTGYAVYGHPVASVPEFAFNVMVLIRTLIQEGQIKNKREFDNLVKKYFTDPQYAPLKETEE